MPQRKSLRRRVGTADPVIASAIPNNRPSPEQAAAQVASGSDAADVDPWISRARPGFLYLIYAIVLWTLPIGVIGAFSPRVAAAMAGAMTAYLNGLPEPLYALFGTGYLGYAALRQWGKVSGSDK
jgi:hypothetical protein